MNQSETMLSERLPGYEARDKDVKRAEKLTSRIAEVRERMRARQDCPFWFIEEMDDILYRVNCLIGPLEHHRDELLRKWLPMGSAPRDGTTIRAKIPGHGEDNIIAWNDGLLDANWQEAGGWYFIDHMKAPPCWTDGVCWAENEDGEPSILPTGWMPIPQPPELEIAGQGALL